MRKIFLLFFAATFIFSISNATVAIPTSLSEIEQPQYEIGYGVKISYEQLKKLTSKEYKKLTGHRLGLKKKIVLRVIQKKLSKEKPYAAGKSQLTAAILALFLGTIGVHRFYLGYTWQGIVQILTLGGLGIWALIDCIRIFTGDLQPKDGEYETTL